MGYSLTFEITTIPKTLNEALRAHWSVNSKERVAIGLEMAVEFRGRLPKGPLEKAKVTIWRHSSGKLDRDNKFFTAKYILDNLVQLKVLENDTEENIESLKVFQVKIKRNEKRFIKVKVEEA